MSNPFSSLQEQSPTSDAQQSVTKAHRAVRQAQSHPSIETIENARNAIDRADRALSHAEMNNSHEEPLLRAREEYQQDCNDLDQVIRQFNM